jgi:hypothetical protein
MSRSLLVLAALLVAALVPAARAAPADLPSPMNWIIPPYLTLVG